MILNGNKNNHTDLHSKVARDSGIDRDTAKVFNYARLYGASSHFAANLLRAANATAKTMSNTEALHQAFNMTRLTKGTRDR